MKVACSSARERDPGESFHIEIESFKQEEKWNESRFMWKSCAPKQGGGGDGVRVASREKL